MPDNYTPETPGSDITFTKPNIPDCWTPEGGGGGGGTDSMLIVNLNPETGKLDKTWQEIYDATYAVIQMGQELNGVAIKAYIHVQGVQNIQGAYAVIATAYDNASNEFVQYLFEASEADDYPTMSTGG